MRRDKIAIYRDVLKACMEGERKTRISYKAGIEFRRLNSILEKLIDAGLIEVQSGSVIYKITEEGKIFLKILEKL